MQQLRENRHLTINDLTEIRKELKVKVDLQQDVMLASAKRLVPFNNGTSVINLGKKSLSPLKLMTMLPLRRAKRMTLVEGIVIGYKVMSSVKRFVRRR